VTKLLAIPNDITNIDELIKIGMDGFILGVKEFSVFINLQLTMEQLKPIITKIKSNGKKVFIAINKVIYNQDIPLLKEYLLILDNLDINGIMYDDISIVNLSRKLKIKTPLGWMSEHLATNYHTCNYWRKQGIKYAVLANEITLDSILNIRNHTKIPLMIRGYGYLPMSQSSRSLISNYFTYVNKSLKNSFFHMYEKERKVLYPIYEDENGTYILSSHILNLIDELPILVAQDIDYIILDSLAIEQENFVKVCQCYKEALLNLDNKELLKKLNKDVEQYSNYKNDKGFLYKKTIYRVKHYE
jgi:putative protease